MFILASKEDAKIDQIKSFHNMIDLNKLSACGCDAIKLCDQQKQSNNTQSPIKTKLKLEGYR